ncbi:MAG TPA: MAPEG family protein [Candidatus Acidoferrales bacterium]|nr:MAPEG family protein [Candidatus Acidoferrales bacterium]
MILTVQNYNLFYPMLAMFIWTLIVMLLNVQVRTSALRRGELTHQYFELFRGAEPSEAVLKAGNHLRNLSEIPPLFYVVSLAIMVTNQTDGLFASLAWSYVVLRVGHGLVHLTIDKVPVRFFFFFLSNLALAIMWLRLGLRL